MKQIIFLLLEYFLVIDIQVFHFIRFYYLGFQRINVMVKPFPQYCYLIQILVNMNLLNVFFHYLHQYFMYLVDIIYK